VTPAKADYGAARRGDTIPERVVTVSQDGAPLDLSGVDIQADFEVGRSRVQLRVGSGITKTDAAAGQFRIDGFQLKQSGTWSYDLQLVYADGVVRTLLYGQIQVVEDVTK